MKLLLDTHTFFWGAVSPSKLNGKAARAIDNNSNEVWFSPVSILELATLERKGRVRIDGTFGHWVMNSIARLGCKEAPMTFEVALETRGVALPHSDPVDRILAATARAFGLTLVTADEALLSARGVPTMRAN